MHAAERAVETVGVGGVERKRSIWAAVNDQFSVFENHAQRGLRVVAGVNAGECSQVRWRPCFDALPDVFPVDRIGQEHFVVCESHRAVEWTAVECERTVLVFDFDREVVANIAVKTGLVIFGRTWRVRGRKAEVQAGYFVAVLGRICRAGVAKNSDGKPFGRDTSEPSAIASRRARVADLGERLELQK